MPENLLFYGDNLDVLRQHVKDDSVDLIYLDPPFNSNADYNVLFAEQDGTRAAAQIKAFKDTWRWDQAAAFAFHDVVENGPSGVSQAMQAFRTLLGENDMLAYLAMMAPRLVELHRVLKPTGSIYLHCDPTASHYLKLLMDGVFGAQNFVNEIVWKRTNAHSDAKQGSTHFGRVNDNILFYSKTGHHTWNSLYSPHDEKYMKSHYPYTEEGTGRRYGLWDVGGPGGAAKGNPFYEIFGISRFWRYSQVNMGRKIEEGRVIQTKPGMMPREKKYLDESRGVPVGTNWTDIFAINSQAQERLGYPTQKPEALLERIIRASSNEGDSVLDPFCGCGTTVAVAQRTNRRWVGIDVTHLAITLIKSRLLDAHGPDVTKTYKVIGEPTTLHDAMALAHEKDRYQFQYWSLGLVGARPLQADQKKGADKGIDGRLFFHDDAESAKSKQVVISVKSGGLKADDVRAISHVLEREKAEIGVLISMEEPTQKMRTDAASVGFYKSPWGTSHPRLQIVTVAELLAGKRIDMPPSLDLRTFKKAPKAKKEAAHKDQFLRFEEPDEE